MLALTKRSIHVAFDGCFTFNKPLERALAEKINAINDYLDPVYIKKYGKPPTGRCEWFVTSDFSGDLKCLSWTGNMTFHTYIEWLMYLTMVFLDPEELTLRGEVAWKGNAAGDAGIIVIGRAGIIKRVYTTDA
jgi:hypothetical protein